MICLSYIVTLIGNIYVSSDFFAVINPSYLKVGFCSCWQQEIYITKAIKSWTQIYLVLQRKKYLNVRQASLKNIWQSATSLFF